MKRLNFNIISALICLAFIGQTGMAFAAVPRLINYQGKLTDKEGNPLDGAFDITFRLYDAAAGGQLLWEEAHTGQPVQKGIFSILLGSIKPLNLVFDKTYYLGVRVGTDSEMSPRQLLSSTGYVLMAESSQTAQDADTIDGIHASTTPAPGKLLPLSDNAKLSSSVLKTYDSGWFPINGGNNYTKEHGLKTTKLLITIYSAKDQDGRDTVMEGVIMPGGIGMTITDITPTNFTLHVATYFNWVAYSGTSKYPGINSGGYARLIALALE
jgi:hypothetical protein